MYPVHKCQEAKTKEVSESRYHFQNMSPVTSFFQMNPKPPKIALNTEPVGHLSSPSHNKKLICLVVLGLGKSKSMVPVY